MKSRLAVGLAMLASALLGAAAVQELHAQIKQPIYVIGEIDDTKAPAAEAKEYGRKMNALIKSHGGHFIAKGGIAGLKVTALDGTAPNRVVIIAWDNMGQIQAWRDDPQFRPTRQIVDKYSNFRVYAVEGFR